VQRETLRAAALLLAGLVLPLGLAAQEPESEEPAEAEKAADDNPWQIGGFVDLYTTYNTNNPAAQTNFFPGAGVAGKRNEEFALNWAALEIKRDPKPVGFHLIAGTGNAIEVLHSGEPEGETVGRDEFRNIYRASVSYKVSDRLTVEGGIYPSHIGFESGLTRDNWNYTGSWGANFTPYYQTGVKAVWSFADGWSAGVHVLNGWQIIADNNGAKSLGAHVGWSGERGSVTLNGWYGPELPGDDDHIRSLIDVVATVKPTEVLSLAFDGHVGRQELPGSATAEWTALTAYLRYQLAETWAVTLRAEQFDDPDGGISGVSQTLEEGTLTLEHRLHKQAVIKLEGRYDRSDARVFSGEDPAVAERDQFLFALATIFTF
jgi:hypothetical protein